MATVETIMTDARTHVRDFPHFFRTTVASLSGTKYIDLPYQNVSQAGLEVKSSVDGVTWRAGAIAWDGDPPSGSFTYELDDRSGVIAIADDAALTAGSFVNVAGYHHEWLSDRDLKFYALNVIAEHSFEVPGFTIETVSDVHSDVISLGTACEAMISLLVEFSRDIDIATPEALTVPTTQRFRQLMQLIYGPKGLVDRYNEKANMTQTGLNRARVYTLRRVSQGTERLVPVYEPREYDDQAWPHRVFPRTDSQGPSNPGPNFVPARRIRNPNQNGGPNP